MNRKKDKTQIIDRSFMANKLVLLNYFFFNDKQSLHAGPKIGSRYVGQGDLGLLTISVGTKAFSIAIPEAEK